MTSPGDQQRRRIVLAVGAIQRESWIANQKLFGHMKGIDERGDPQRRDQRIHDNLGRRNARYIRRPPLPRRNQFTLPSAVRIFSPACDTLPAPNVSTASPVPDGGD